jgi:hypothetical protein
MSTAVPAGKVTGVPAGICTAGQSRFNSTETTFCITVRERFNLADHGGKGERILVVYPFAEKVGVIALR